MAGLTCKTSEYTCLVYPTKVDTLNLMNTKINQLVKDMDGIKEDICFIKCHLQRKEKENINMWKWLTWRN